MTPDSAEGKRDGENPESLFGLLGGVFLICALFLLALGLAEAIDRALTPLDNFAHTLVFLALALILLLGAALVSHLTGWGREVGSKIKGPDVLEQGRARIQGWQARLNLRLMVYGTFLVPVWIIALEAPELIVGSNPDGSFDFRHWFIMIVSTFGFLVVWLLISSLIAGLWPNEPGVKTPDVLRKGYRKLNGWFDFSRHPLRSIFWMVAPIAVLGKTSSAITATMVTGTSEPLFSTLVYILILYGLVISALLLSILLAGLLAGEPGKE